MGTTSLEMSQRSEISATSYTLQVDFSWKRFKTLISKKADPKSKPIYIVDYKTLTPTFIFRSGEDYSSFASGTLYPVSIDVKCDIHGQAIPLHAMKRWRTKYSYLSRLFSENDTPVLMTWTANFDDFKTWTFTCCDPQGQAVARFSVNFWALRKVGTIEFCGPKAGDDAAMEEIVVTALTLYHCMSLRMCNQLSLIGSATWKPNRSLGIDATSNNVPERVGEEDESRRRSNGVKHKVL